GAVAGVSCDVAARADGAVAVRHPRLALGRVARRGEACHEADLRRPAVLVREGVEVEAGGGALEFGGTVRGRAAQRRGRLAFLGRVAPLHDQVVLRAVDAYAVPVALVGEGADVRHVLGRELRRELDHHAAGGQLQVDRVVRIQ